MKLHRRFTNLLIRAILKLKLKSTLARLCNVPDKESKLLLEALSESLNNIIAPEEMHWIDKIESVREKLNSSATIISRVDYGAGASNQMLSSEEMYKGKIVNSSVGKISRTASKEYFWSLFLFKLIRKFKPQSCLELGTCLGISASFQAAALELNQQGSLITLEGAESLASIAVDNLESLKLNRAKVITGRFQDTLKSVLETTKSVDYVFIDGHHDGNATLSYFYQVIPYLSPNALVILDDISWSAGMKRAWNTIREDVKVKFSVDLKQLGICMIGSGMEKIQTIK